MIFWEAMKGEAGPGWGSLLVLGFLVRVRLSRHSAIVCDRFSAEALQTWTKPCADITPNMTAALQTSIQLVVMCSDALGRHGAF